jgi:thymidylate synthase (FAD)
MKIIEPSYKILQCPDGEQCLAFLERCARTCYKSEDKIDDGVGTCPTCNGGCFDPVPPKDARGIELSCRTCYGTGRTRLREPSSHKLIRHVLKSGHESVIEHMVITVRFIVDRGVSHELVRHRIGISFSQESTRYCRYDKSSEGKELTLIRPTFWTDDEKATNWSPVVEIMYTRWLRSMQDAEDAYNDLVSRGTKPEEARSVLPNSLKTEIVTTANLREWRHILKLRTSPKAHPQMRQVMIPLLAELQSKVPIIFDDVGA